MPLNRTPTKSPPSSVFMSPLLTKNFSSETDITEVGTEAGLSAASSSDYLALDREKLKRKRESLKVEKMDKIVAEQKRQDEKLDRILVAITDMKTTVNGLSSKQDEVLAKINFLEKERKSHISQIQELQIQNEMLQRHIRGTSVEIRNISHGSNETKNDLKKHVIKLAEIVKCSVGISDIKDVRRSYTKAESKPIIADFLTVDTRNNFLSACKQYNKTHKNARLNTSLLNINGDPKPLYVSENLTPNERKLFYQAREFAKKNGYMHCWATSGRIFLRKEEGAPHVRVSCHSDLDNLKTQ